MENTLFAMLLKRSKEVDMPSLVGFLYPTTVFKYPCPALNWIKTYSVTKLSFPEFLEGKNPYGPPMFQKVDLYNQSETVAMHYDRIIPSSSPISRLR